MPWKRLETFAQRPLVKGAGAAWAVRNAWMGAISIVSGVGVLWKWGSSNMLAPLFAILTAFAAFMCLRVAIEPGVSSAVVAWGRSRIKSQWTQITGAPATSVNRPIELTPRAERDRPSQIDHLCRLRLYEEQLPRFEDAISKAKTTKDTLLSLYSEAMTGGLLDASRSKLDNAEYEFIAALQSADMVYRNVFRQFINMSLTDPVRRQNHPIEGLKHLPDDRHRREYQLLHDRIASLNANEGAMRGAFIDAIKTSRAAVCEQAERSIANEQQGK